MKEDTPINHENTALSPEKAPVQTSPETESSEKTKDSEKNHKNSHHDEAYVHQSLIRSFIIFIFASVALALLSLSILSYWAENTLLNTNNYVNTVTPLAKDPTVQKFVTDKTSDLIIDQVGMDELAQKLQPDSYGKVPIETLTPVIKKQVHAEVAKAISSPQFPALWAAANRDIHTQLIAVINGTGTTATISIQNSVNQFTKAFEGTQLAFVNVDINKAVDKNATTTLKVDQLTKIRNTFKETKKGILFAPIIGFIALVIALLISRHRWRTFSSIAMQMALICLVYAFAIQLFAQIPFKNVDLSTISTLQASEKILLVGLRNLFVAVGVISLILGLGAFFRHRQIVHRNSH